MDLWIHGSCTCTFSYSGGGLLAHNVHGLLLVALTLNTSRTYVYMYNMYIVYIVCMLNYMYMYMYMYMPLFLGTIISDEC